MRVKVGPTRALDDSVDHVGRFSGGGISAWAPARFLRLSRPGPSAPMPRLRGSRAHLRSRLRAGQSSQSRRGWPLGAAGPLRRFASISHKIRCVRRVCFAVFLARFAHVFAGCFASFAAFRSVSRAFGDTWCRFAFGCADVILQLITYFLLPLKPANRGPMDVCRGGTLAARFSRRSTSSNAKRPRRLTETTARRGPCR